MRSLFRTSPAHDPPNQARRQPIGVAFGGFAPLVFLFIACASPPPATSHPDKESQPVPTPEIETRPLPTSSPQPLKRPASAGTIKHTGVFLAPTSIPLGPELEPWVQSLADRGVTMVLLDIGTREGMGQRGGDASMIGTGGGVFFRTGWARTERDVFGELIPVAHLAGISVFAATSLRRMNWVDPTLGWVDRSYDPVRAQVRLSPFLDLFHPAFHEYLVGLLTDLAATGIDGLLFRNDSPLGPTDGFSQFAIRGFEHDFHIRADLAKLAPLPASALDPSGRPAAIDAARGQETREFWQWAGWKARETLKVMVRLRRAMLAQAPALQFAIEIHTEAFSDPLTALVQYSEDLLEAKRAGFQFFLLRDSSPSALLLERLEQHIPEKERIWAPVFVQAADSQQTDDWLSAARAREDRDRGIGLIYIRN